MGRGLTKSPLMSRPDPLAEELETLESIFCEDFQRLDPVSVNLVREGRIPE